jgi:hypothetical protein
MTAHTFTTFAQHWKWQKLEGKFRIHDPILFHLSNSLLNMATAFTSVSLQQH